MQFSFSFSSVSFSLHLLWEQPHHLIHPLWLRDMHIFLHVIFLAFLLFVFEIEIFSIFQNDLPSVFDEFFTSTRNIAALPHSWDKHREVCVHSSSVQIHYSPAKTFSSKSLGIDNQFSWVFKIKIIPKITVKLQS